MLLHEIAQCLFENKEFLLNLLCQHIMLSFVAIIIAIILGGIVGILISEIASVSKPVLACVDFLYTIPSIALFGFLIPFSGVGNISAIIALVIYALLPMVRNVYSAIINIDRDILEAAEAMGSTSLQVLFRIKIPLALPMVLSGIRNMTTMTIALAGIASFVGAGGLGVAIYRGITTNNIAMTVTGSLLIAGLALIVNVLLERMEKFLLRRRRGKNKHIKKAGIVLCFVILLSLFLTFQINKKDTIRIATKPMTEQYILGEMLDLLIEDRTDLSVELTQGIGGGTANIQPAMLKGEFDIYPEYTATAWKTILKQNNQYTNDNFSTLQQEYKDMYRMQWIGMYGFRNTYAIAIRKDIAEKYHITTCSDLQRIDQDLIFGAENDFFEREDAYNSLTSTYNLHFKSTMDLDIGLKYQAINQGKIDIMPVFTTDGQLKNANIVILQDDKNIFAQYMCGNVVRQDVLQKYPELISLLQQLDNSITDENMAAMNYAVECEGKNPRDVAYSFLREKGFIQ